MMLCFPWGGRAARAKSQTRTVASAAADTSADAGSEVAGVAQSAAVTRAV